MAAVSNDNIKVGVRVRPFLPRELARDPFKIVNMEVSCNQLATA